MAELATELNVAAVLGEDGIIGEHIADFESRASQLGMAELISETIALGDVEAAFHKMENGEVLRSVVVF